MPKYEAECPDCGRDIEWYPNIEKEQWYHVHAIDFKTACCGSITVARKPDNEPEVPAV